MAFHSLFVVSAANHGEVLLQRVYEAAASGSDCVEALVAATLADWTDVGSLLRVAAVLPGTVTVYSRVGDLVFLLSGSGDYDELVCGETVRSLMELVVAQCNGTENDFLAQHDRISLLVDHVIRHGVLEHTGGPCLAAMINGATEPVTAAAARASDRELERVSVAGYALPTLVVKGGKPMSAATTRERPRVNSTVVVAAPKKK